MRTRLFPSTHPLTNALTFTSLRVSFVHQWNSFLFWLLLPPRYEYYPAPRLSVPSHWLSWPSLPRSVFVLLLLVLVLWGQDLSLVLTPLHLLFPDVHYDRSGFHFVILNVLMPSVSPLSTQTLLVNPQMAPSLAYTGMRGRCHMVLIEEMSGMIIWIINTWFI
ncbi:hypothetical protein B0T13DRAFT_70224 [Neurospora crassa]|nr:hypothetical protein B0T13DRAFT_70224 [Neurospora crassa]